MWNSKAIFLTLRSVLFLYQIAPPLKSMVILEPNIRCIFFFLLSIISKGCRVFANVPVLLNVINQVLGAAW